MTNWKKKHAEATQANLELKNENKELCRQNGALYQQLDNEKALSENRFRFGQEKVAERNSLAAALDVAVDTLEKVQDERCQLQYRLNAARIANNTFAARIAALQPLAQEFAHGAVTALKLLDVISLREDARETVDAIGETLRAALLDLVGELRDTAEKALRAPQPEDAEEWFPEIVVVLPDVLG